MIFILKKLFSILITKKATIMFIFSNFKFGNFTGKLFILKDDFSNLSSLATVR